MKTKLILLVGPPCVGKSTWSKEYLAKNPETIRICRDDLRMMLRGQMVLEDETEQIIDDITYTIIEDAFANENDIIIDQTNCKLKYISNFYNRYSRDSDIEIRIKTFEVPPIGTLFARNMNRAKTLNMDPIPSSVIEAMVKNYTKLLEHEDFKKLVANSLLV